MTPKAINGTITVSNFFTEGDTLNRTGRSNTSDDKQAERHYYANLSFTHGS
jgi:hypothetical protein